MRKTVHFFIRLMLVSIVVVLTINKHSVCQTQTFNYTGSMQYFTVPAGVTTVTIEVSGAQGGSSGTNLGGLGAKMKGDFVVTPGQQLKVLVGGQGGSSYYSAGGGGGSFVTDMSNNPLCIAGGGGGAYLFSFSSNSYYSGALVTTSAQAGILANYSGGSSLAGAGGVNGNGGGANTSIGGVGAGGGGFYSNGSSGGGATGGASFLNGGAGGGNCGSAGYGGYGGGGGADHCDYMGSGGGGGYSGGGGGAYYGVGGGGGSYNSGTNVYNLDAFNSGNGIVTFTWDAGCSGMPTSGVISAYDTIAHCVGNMYIILSGGSTGTGISYQWQSAPDNNGVPGTFTDMSGETYNYYSNYLITTTTWYRCLTKCAGSGMSATSNEIRFTVYPNPLAGTVMIFNNTGACSANGFLNAMNGQFGMGVGYQWQSALDNNGVPGTYSDINGAMQNMYQATNVTQTTWYRLVYTCYNSGLTATSDSVKITVTPQPTAGYVFANIDSGGCSMEAYLDLYDATNGSSIAYQWQSAPDINGVHGTYTNIQGATTTNLDAPNVAQSTWYRCVVMCTSSGMADTSLPQLITITPQVEAGTAFASTESGICSVDSYINLNGNSSGSNVTYEWQSAPDINGTPGVFTDIFAGTNNFYHSTSINQTTWYRCVLTCNSNGSKDTSSLQEIILEPIVGGTTNASVNPVCNGVIFTLSLTGETTSGVFCQWQSAPDINGNPGTFTNILNANNFTLTTTQQGATWYRCQISCYDPNGGTSLSTNLRVGKCVSTYCVANGGCDEHISKVEVGSINNTSSCSSGATLTTQPYQHQ